MIEARTLQGFRDYLPAAMLARERLIATARDVYRSFGYCPIDTPALEYLDILTGKGGEETDKQLYKFQDQGERWVGLRFDLTVPLARFAAQHIGQLGTPFKRYHIATVWRGERAQRGRYREFMQCDFDTLGTRSSASDIETALVIHELLSALGFARFSLRVNNRQVLSGLLARLGVEAQGPLVLRALDKLPKIGPEKVAEEMTGVAGLSPAAATEILGLANLRGSNDQILRQVEKLVAGNPVGEAGVASLAELVKATQAAGIPPERLRLDVSIARGLDYYTGVVFETFLADLPDIGSVCSGGRYDNLAGLYTKQDLPGVGTAWGWIGCLSAMEILGMLPAETAPAPVFLPWFVAERLDFYLGLAAELRRAGVGVEFFPEARRLGQQLKYADRRGYRLAVIVGEDELAQQTCQLKDLRGTANQVVSLAAGSASLVGAIQDLLRQDVPAGENTSTG